MTKSPSDSQVTVCLRCGRGFILTSTYLDLLERRQVKVAVPVLCATCFLTQGPVPKQPGEVKWFNPRKGYGFIITGEGEEVFFHQEQIVADPDQVLREGEAVRFHLHFPPKGPEALNVEPSREANASPESEALVAEAGRISPSLG